MFGIYREVTDQTNFRTVFFEKLCRKKQPGKKREWKIHDR
jgi:hypothetical protein